MEPFLSLLLNAGGGALGGNVIGGILRNISLGPIGNTLAGAIGGGLGSAFLPELLGIATGGGSDITTMAMQVLSGGASGGILTLVLGIIRKLVAK